ncbi:MAG: hypothetical protein ACYC8T_19675 [Myxococcaceae bacterium]
MTGTALLLALLLTGADDLASTKVEGLQLKVPSAWKATPAEKGTVHYDSPTSDGSFELSVFPVAPRRDGKLCVDQLLKAMGDEGWKPVTIGGAPAAQKITTEATPEEGEGKDKKLPVEVQTNSYVGCNGATKWVLTLTMHTKSKARYDALAKKVVGGIAYAK